MINTYNLFATPVTHAKMPLAYGIHKKIISFVENNYNEDELRSIVNGFQFHGDFDGKEELDNNLNIFLENILKLKICHSWLNVLGDNSYNKPHYHTGNSTISYSGVYYLSPQNNNINFAKDGNVFELRPILFDLLIFPYDLLHYVLPENRSEKRICYSFNLININEGE